MTRKDFHLGYVLLRAQRYPNYERPDEDKEKVLAESYWLYFQAYPADVWAAAIHQWVGHQDHFPLIPELLQKVKETKRFRYPDMPAIPAPSVPPLTRPTTDWSQLMEPDDESGTA